MSEINVQGNNNKVTGDKISKKVINSIGFVIVIVAIFFYILTIINKIV